MEKQLKKFNPGAISQWLLKIWTLVFFIFIPLYPKFPLTFFGKETVAIRLDDLVVSAGILIFLINQLTGGFAFFKKKITKVFLFFFLAGLLSLINGVFILKTVSLSTAAFHYLRRIEYASLFFIVYYSLTKKKFIFDYFIALSISLVGVIIYGLGQKFFSWPVISTMNPEFAKGILLQMSQWTRINSTFAGHYDLAAFFSLILVFLPAVIILTKDKFCRFLEIIVWLASFYILVLTASRISFSAYFLVIVLVLWFLKKRIWIVPVLILNIVVFFSFSELNQRLMATFKTEKFQKIKNQVVLTLNIERYFPKKKIVIIPTPTLAPEPTLIPVLLSPTPRPKKKTATPSAEPIYHETIAMGTERSTSIRFNAEWPRALRAFLKNPLFGTGYGSITLATDNDYLRLLGEAGILGLLSFFLIFFLFIKKSTRFVFGKVRDPLIIGFWGCLMIMFLNAMFIDVFEASKVAYVFWALFGLTFKLLDLKPKA